MSNTRIWDSLSKTDPKQTKAFKRSGGFQGTAIKPIWLDLRLTEQFGPCGIGWGFEKPEFQVIPANKEILVYCTVELWYMDAGSRAKVYGVGGDKVLAENKYGLSTDDEAFKKSFTDALGNAMKFIGAAADIHLGMFEDNKYVQKITKEFAEEERGSKEAAQAVASQKLERAKTTGESVNAPIADEQLKATTQQAEGNKFKEMLGHFSDIKKQLAASGLESEYYAVLGSYGVEHANQFRDFSDARKCYKSLCARVVELKRAEDLVTA